MVRCREVFVCLFACLNGADSYISTKSLCVWGGGGGVCVCVCDQLRVAWYAPTQCTINIFKLGGGGGCVCVCDQLRVAWYAPTQCTINIFKLGGVCVCVCDQLRVAWYAPTQCTINIFKLLSFTKTFSEVESVWVEY